jgi:hypothetical protein
MKTLSKVILTGVITTVCRLVFQMLIPDSDQTVLPPSVFVEKGVLPLAFLLYALIVYSVIAAMFLLIRERAPGGKLSQGIRYGAALGALWVVYLWEPLPHQTSIMVDGIAYCLADGTALLVMGAMAGLLLGKSGEKAERIIQPSKVAAPVAVITIAFVCGRLLQYFVCHIYSSFDTKPVETVLWGAATGLTTAIVLFWFNSRIQPMGGIRRTLVLGCVLFGANLWLFNFFMPLVFKVDIVDLIERTVIDILAVTTGVAIILHKDRMALTKEYIEPMTD